MFPIANEIEAHPYKSWSTFPNRPTWSRWCLANENGSYSSFYCIFLMLDVNRRGNWGQHNRNKINVLIDLVN